jgi:hypothetical protein
MQYNSREIMNKASTVNVQDAKKKEPILKLFNATTIMAASIFLPTSISALNATAGSTTTPDSPEPTDG